MGLRSGWLEMSRTFQKREDRAPSSFSGWMWGWARPVQWKDRDPEGHQHDPRDGPLQPRTRCFS